MNTLLLIGHGKMGGLLLERIASTALFSAIHVISPRHTQKDSGIVHWHRDLASLPQAVVPSVLLLAVKPAMLESLLPAYAARFASAPLYLSVAAGKTLAFYRRHLGANAHIVRAMPNTPSLIGEGMTTLCAENTLSAFARKTATDIMQNVGEVLWIEEAQMDAATAIGGCGPAYVFLFMEALVKAGLQSGLTESQAKALTQQTLRGSVALAAQSGKTYAELCAQVASPGGATEAGMRVLNAGEALQILMEKTVQAAIARTREMAAETKN